MMYELLHPVASPLAKVVWRPTVEGVDNVPKTGGVIIASNHLSFVDSVVIPIVAPRKVVFMAKADYFTQPGVKGALWKGWYSGLGMVPVDRDDTQKAIESLEVGLDILRQGEAFGIYPEGTRSRDGRLYRGRTGVAYLALTAGVPVVPVGLANTAALQPVGSNLPRLAHVTVRFGPVIDFSGRFDGVPPGRARRQATDEIMAGIHALTGQERAGVYNERPAEPAPGG